MKTKSVIIVDNAKAKKQYFYCGPFWRIKKENFSVGKYRYNREKAVESRLNKKLDSLREMFVKKHQ